MGKKFWLQFALNEALDVLMAYGTVADPDPNLQTRVANANAAIKDLINYLTSGGK